MNTLHPAGNSPHAPLLEAAAPSPGADSAEESASHLERLRIHVTGPERDSELEHLLEQVSETMERLTAENNGMTEELLCVYEQLGIIFEVTQCLRNVHSEAEVVDLFVDSLRRTFQGRDVFLVDSRWLKKTSRGNDAGPHDHRAQRNGSAWFAAVVRQARDQGKALVEAPPTGAAPDWVTEALVGPVFAGDPSGAESSSSFVGAIVLTRNADADAFRAGDMLLLDSLTRFCGDLIRNQRLVHEMREMSLSMVRSLVNAVDQKDAYTSGHSLRVGYFATLLGKALRLKGTDLLMLQWSALLHDVGKIGIRDDVLKKAGKLTKEEFDHMKEHPERSHSVVREVRHLAGALDGVLHHHERYDGTGYPAGLTGEDIPIQARIIQVADVFDALTSTRSYRPAFNWRGALDILKEEAGKTIDPNLQGIFDGLIREPLEGDPDGWEKMIQSANRFTEVDEEYVPGTNGE